MSIQSASKVAAEIHLEDRKRREGCLAALRWEVGDPVEGLCPDGGWERRIWRETAVMSAVPLAMVLEVLLPDIAEALANTGSYATDAIGRGKRTIQAKHTFVFGDLEKAIAVSSRVCRLHERVIGTISEQTSRQRIGKPYRGNDPFSGQWVDATIVYSGLRLYEAVVEPLGPADRESFYQESKRCAMLMGLPREQLPEDWNAFERYFDRMVNEELELGETAKEILRVLFSPLYSRNMGLLTVGFLPERWRGVLGFPWNDETKRAHEREIRRLRAARVVPPLIRYVPAYHQAKLRIDMARNHSLSPSAWVVRALDKRGWIPYGLLPGGRRVQA